VSISDEQLLATHKVWSARLYVGSDPTLYHLTELPARTLGQDQQRGTCTMTLTSFPVEAAGTTAYVEITLNGETARFFTGKVDVRPIADNPPQYQVSLIDTLGRLNKQVNSTITWSNKAWNTAVRELLNRAGITDGEIAEIYDPGNDFKLGNNYAIVVEKGQTVEAIIRDLLAFAGADMATDENGLVHVIDSPGWPEDESDILYAYGADKGFSEFGITSSRRTLGGSEDVIKSFTAKGPRRPDRSIPDATFTRTDIDEGDHEEQEYKFCQTNDCARAIAQREIVRRNRQSTEVEVTAPLHPGLKVGDTVMYRNEWLGFDIETASLILALSSNDHTMTMRLSVGARPPEGTIHINPPPDADFTALFEQQPIVVAGSSAVRILVQCTDTSSDSGGFHIESWAWTASCASAVDPESSDERNPNFIFDTLDDAQITLVVESTSGEGNSKTISLEPTPGEVFTRVISAATDAGWFVLAGSSGWRSYGSDCTAVPGINDQGPMIAGFSGGELRQTQDFLLSEPELLATLEGGEVRCLFVNEGNPQDILAGVGANLHHSTDGGVTWESIHVFDDDINYVESSPVEPLQITVCCGKFVYQAFDGSSFEIALTGPDGSTCRKIASAPWGALAVWSGTETVEDAYQFLDAGTLDWSGVLAQFMPIDLASVTPLQYEEGYLIASGAANDIVRDGLYQQLAYLASGGLSIPLYKATGSGGAFVVEYRATGVHSGVNKVVNHKSTFLIAEPEVCFRVGYGQPTDTPEPPDLIILPTIAGSDFYHHRALLGWEIHPMPIPFRTWSGLAINDANPAEWIAWCVGPTQLFHTPNMGLTWTEIYIPQTNSPVVRSLTFIGLGSQWVACITYNLAAGVARYTQAYYAQGNGANNEVQKTFGDNLVPPAPSGPGYDIIYQILAGADGAMCGSGNNHPDNFFTGGYGPGNERWYRLDPAILTPTFIEASTYGPWDTRMANANAALGTWNTNVGYTVNHQGAAPTAVISAGGTVVEVETGVFAGTREGIAKIVDFDTAPVVSIVAGAGESVGRIVRGRRRRGIAAMGTERQDAVTPEVAYNFIYSFNGVQWTTIQTPLGYPVDTNVLGIVEL
jgi:hypothetical protein